MRAEIPALAACALACTSGDHVPEFEVGFRTDGHFEPVPQEGDCPVVDAVQTGYWVMPYLRTFGMDATVETGCILEDLDSGELLGENHTERTFEEAEDGWREFHFMFALERVGGPDEYAELDGNRGLLSCYVDDGSVALDYEAQVLLRAISLSDD